MEEAQAEYQKLMEGQNIVLRNADEAYKTAGLSANEYMETVTGFAASLKQSTENEVEAAKAADQAVIDMSDNANKMGSSMESIQNAYQGFAKQNYTMLDNLRLGYGGTKEEMARLLEDASKLSGVEYDMSNLADVYEAIHVVQTELGITGTTAKEASSTISGSLNAMKSSWTNLLTGIADDDADFETLIDNFVNSAVAAGENLIPRIEVAIEGIGDLIEEMLPIILDTVPGIINDIMPDLLESGANLIVSLVEGLQNNLDVIAEGAVSIITQLSSALIELLPMLLDIGLQIILQLALGLGEALPELIPSIVEVILQMVETLTNPDNIGLLVDAACQIMIGLAEGLIKALPQLLIKAPEIMLNTCEALIEAASQLGVAAFEMMVVIGKGLIDSLPEIIRNIPQIIDNIQETFSSFGNAFMEIGANIVDGIWNGLKNGWGDVVAWASEAAKNILQSVKDTLGIHSPSKEFAKVGAYCSQGMIEGYEENDPVKAIGKSTSASMAAVEANTSYARYQNEVKSSDFAKFAGDLKTDTNVTVQIEADPDGLFRVVRKSEKEYYDRTGKGPFEHKK